MDLDWFWISTVLCLLAFIALVWVFVDDATDEPADNSPDPGWRDRKAAATSYWEMAEYRDSIEDGRPE